jgi:hypothetical protein
MLVLFVLFFNKHDGIYVSVEDLTLYPLMPPFDASSISL